MAPRYILVEIDDEQLTDEQKSEGDAIGTVMSCLEHFHLSTYVVELMYNPLEGAEED